MVSGFYDRASQACGEESLCELREVAIVEGEGGIIRVPGHTE